MTPNSGVMTPSAVNLGRTGAMASPGTDHPAAYIDVLPMVQPTDSDRGISCGNDGWSSRLVLKRQRCFSTADRRHALGKRVYLMGQRAALYG